MPSLRPAVKSGNPLVFLRVPAFVVLCCALLASGCAEPPDTALAAAQAAWSQGDDDAVLERLTAPSAGLMRLLAFADERFRAVPRAGGASDGAPEVDAPAGATSVVARLPGASGQVSVRLVREGRAWRIDLVATEAQGRDDGERGSSP